MKKLLLSVSNLGVILTPFAAVVSCSSENETYEVSLDKFLSNHSRYPHGSENIVAYKLENGVNWSNIKYLWFQFESGYIGNIKIGTEDKMSFWINTGAELPNITAQNYYDWAIKNQNDRTHSRKIYKFKLSAFGDLAISAIERS